MERRERQLGRLRIDWKELKNRIRDRGREREAWDPLSGGRKREMNPLKTFLIKIPQELECRSPVRAHTILNSA
jgi:hypothetical protein